MDHPPRNGQGGRRPARPRQDEPGRRTPPPRRPSPRREPVDARRTPPPGRPQPRPAPRARHNSFRGAKIALTVVSLLVMGLTGYAWAAMQGLVNGLNYANVISDGGGGDKPADGARDILLVGLDSRTDAQGNPLLARGARPAARRRLRRRAQHRLADLRAHPERRQQGRRDVAAARLLRRHPRLRQAQDQLRLRPGDAAGPQGPAEAGRHRPEGARRPGQPGRREEADRDHREAHRVDHRQLRRGQPARLQRHHQGHRRRRRLPEQQRQGRVLRRGLHQGPAHDLRRPGARVRPAAPRPAQRRPRPGRPAAGVHGRHGAQGAVGRHADQPGQAQPT